MQYLGTMNEPTDLVNRQYVTQNAGSGGSGGSSGGSSSGGSSSGSANVFDIIDDFYNEMIDLINGEVI